MNGKFCKKCSEPMIMLSKYQAICESCKAENNIGRNFSKNKKKNEKKIK